MSKSVTSLWDTAECESWCRNFSYEDYIKWPNPTKRVSEATYKMLCDAFNNDYYESQGEPIYD